MLAPSPADNGPTILTANDFRAAIAPVMPLLTRYARRLAITAADTDDLLQDTLLKAWAARASFTQGSNLRAWLMRIARNTFLSAHRRGTRQVLWEPDEIARALVTGVEQEDALMLSDLETAIKALPESQRRAFEMVVGENLSYEDAAVRLGVEVGTLKSQVSRARMALVRTLETSPRPRPADPALSDLPRAINASGRRSTYAKWKASGASLIGGPHERLAA